VNTGYVLLYSSVFSLLQKPAEVSDESQTVSDSEFQKWRALHDRYHSTRMQWRHRDSEPGGGGDGERVHKIRQKSQTFYINIINWETELTMVCGKMCGVLVSTNSLPLPTGDICK